MTKHEDGERFYHGPEVYKRSMSHEEIQALEGKGEESLYYGPEVFRYSRRGPAK